jgi:hypothetical protein
MLCKLVQVISILLIWANLKWLISLHPPSFQMLTKIFLTLSNNKRVMKTKMELEVKMFRKRKKKNTMKKNLLLKLMKRKRNE